MQERADQSSSNDAYERKKGEDDKQQEISTKKSDEVTLTSTPSETNSKTANSNYKKKVLVGPKCNQIDFERIINSQNHADLEVEKQTTLMIRNIPIKFN